jgi:uncharacterized protein YunC (DUF1805 family)
MLGEIVHEATGFDKAKPARDNPHHARSSLMKNVDVDLEGKHIQGIEVPLPKAPLVLAYAPNGFVMCGYLNVEVAEKLGVAAAMVRGVSSVNDLLAASVVACTSAAAQRGVKAGMSGKDALACLA